MSIPAWQWRQYRELKAARFERCRLRDQLLSLGRNGEAEAQQDAIDRIVANITAHPCYTATPAEEVKG